jgi:predicted helicase
MVAQLVILNQPQSEDDKIEIIRQFLNYPVKQRDSFGSRFWLLRPGKTEEEARETYPIAISFSSELEHKTDTELKQFLTSDEQDREIRGHYTKRIGEDQPVMYLLLPTDTSQGRVAFILPTEGKLRQRCVQTFTWDDKELTARFERLKQESLETADKIVEKALNFVPQVDWIFYKTVKTAKELAQELAQVTLRLEQAIPRIYKNEGKDGYLHKLFKSFQDELLPNLQLTSDDAKDYSFADIYAQTISYGLFTARVFGYQNDVKQGKKTDFNRFNAWEQLPVTNPFLRNLFCSISQHSTEVLDEELLEAIGEIFGILRAAKMDAILSDFRLKMNREDIVIHFYEEFICAYKPQMRESRGVYYTPKPVVSYIVRSVDHILKNDFGLKDGLADASKIPVKSSNGKDTKEAHKVLITDVATGTATFLHEAINQIYTSFESNPEQWSDYVAKDLLPRLLGFELLMAPYAVAHMKLGLQLAELGYQFDTEERLRVYLTNTLQEAFRIPPAEDSFSNLIWGEADAANRIKEVAPVMVIMGNPPYSGHSANNGEWIKSLLKGKDILTEQQTSSYFEVDGKPLGEKNPKWLNDDYVKFRSFALTESLSYVVKITF